SQISRAGAERGAGPQHEKLASACGPRPTQGAGRRLPTSAAELSARLSIQPIPAGAAAAHRQSAVAREPGPSRCRSGHEPAHGHAQRHRARAVPAVLKGEKKAWIALGSLVTSLT